MKELLKMIQKQFDLKKCDTSFVEITSEIEYIQDTFIHDETDLLITLAYINPDGEVQLVFSN